MKILIKLNKIHWIYVLNIFEFNPLTPDVH